MRIGIDCRTILEPQLGEKAGVGHYTYHLVRSLLSHDKENEYVLFFGHQRPNPFVELERPNVTIKRFPFARYKKFLPFSYSHLLIAAVIKQARLDVFHAPANTLPLSYTGRSVITVHDLAIYKHPKWFPGQVFSTKVLVPQSLKKANRIIAVSQSTATDIQQLFKVPEGKIEVIPEGVEIEFLDLKDKNIDVRRKFGLGKHYLVYVGTLEPRKNLERLVTVFGKLRQSLSGPYRDIQLALAGAPGYRSDQLKKTIAANKLTRYVRLLGYVTQNEKYRLIQNARAFVFPSLYEGFGLPVLEAMALGTPVLTSNNSSLPEVAGGAAAMVDPTDDDSLYVGLKNIVEHEDLRQRLIKAGTQQVKQFHWATMAEKTLAVYRQVATK